MRLLEERKGVTGIEGTFSFLLIAIAITFILIPVTDIFSKYYTLNMAADNIAMYNSKRNFYYKSYQVGGDLKTAGDFYESKNIPYINLFFASYHLNYKVEVISSEKVKANTYSDRHQSSSEYLKIKVRIEDKKVPMIFRFIGIDHGLSVERTFIVPDFEKETKVQRR